MVLLRNGNWVEETKKVKQVVLLCKRLLFSTCHIDDQMEQPCPYYCISSSL